MVLSVLLRSLATALPMYSTQTPEKHYGKGREACFGGSAGYLGRSLVPKDIKNTHYGYAGEREQFTTTPHSPNEKAFRGAHVPRATSLLIS